MIWRGWNKRRAGETRLFLSVWKNFLKKLKKGVYKLSDLMYNKVKVRNHHYFKEGNTMMWKDFEDMIESGRLETDTTCPAFSLVRRCVKELETRAVIISHISGIGLSKESAERKAGDKTVGVRTVYRHNGTAQNVSVEIMIYEYQQRSWGLAEVQIGKIKVPGGASDRVIQNRIDKVLGGSS